MRRRLVLVLGLCLSPEPAAADERVDAALHRLVNAKDWRQEQAAVDELAALGEKATKAVRRAAERHENSKVRLACYHLLTDAFSDDKRSMLTVARSGLRDSDQEVRYLCAFSLGTHRAYAARRRLQAVLDDNQADERTRLAAAKSLAELGEPDGLKRLFWAAGDDSYMSRYMASLGFKALTGKALEDFEGYQYQEGAFVSGGVEAKIITEALDSAEVRAKRFSALVAYCKWLKKERPELYQSYLSPGF